MADPQPAESTTDPPTTVTETERVYRIPNSSWNTSPGHLQHPVITDTRYHMPQVSGSAAWGGSTHLPSLLSMEGYSSRTESGLRSSIHSDSYTEAGIESGEDYGSAYHLENFRRLGLGQGISYRVSSTAHSGRHGIVPEDYTKTCTGQESYSRNYISTYSDTRAGLGHESHYRTITGPNDYSRTSIHQDNYTRSQTADEFYLRSNPVGNGFESESGARTDIGRLDSEVPRDKQTPSSLSAVISVSCTGTFTSQVNKLHCGGDGVCYSGRGGTGTQMAITNTESVSKSSPAVAQGCDPRVRSGSETEHRSSCQGKNAAEFDAGSASAYDSTQSDLSTSSGLEQNQRESPRTEAASQETNHSPRELVANVQSSGKSVSTSATHKDKTKDLSANQKKEIQHFVISCPGTSFEHVAEHFSKIWDIDVTSDIIQQIAKDREKQIIAMQDLSEKMKDAIMSYRKRNQDLSSTDIVSYFTKQWHVTLDEELIERVLNENLLESETGANGCNTNKEDVKENTLHKEDDFKMSKEMKKVISQYKTNHFDMATDEIAEHFSAEWNMKISRETVLNILNEHHDQTPNSSQKIKNSPEHHDNMSTCYLPKDAVVTSGDDLSEEGNYQDGYDNSIAKLVPVTVEEARAGLMKAIAYFMANPSIADGHIRTLWNILHYIDSRDKNTMLPDKDPSSDDENATGRNCSELVDIKQEILEAECSSDAAAESMKSDNFRTSARTASCKMFKARPPANNTYTSIRTKLSNKNRVTSEKADSTEENDAVRKVINVGDVKVDVDQRLKCPECDDSFSEFTQLLDHITRHSEEKLILAHSCGDRLPLGSNSPVLRPRTRGQGRGRPRCVMGENSSQNATDKSGVSPKRKRRIKLQNCTLCGRQFNDYSNFRRHLRLHAGLKPHKCPTCGVSFIESNALKKHMRTHTGEKPYLCTTCGKRVTTLAGLQSHARLHTGEKPFKCTVCGKDFAQSSSLKRHMVIHTGERPYGCPQCGKNFPRSEDLKMHIRTHTGLKPYKCLVCGKCFIKSSYLHKHARIHTGEKPYKCTTCGEAFAQSDILAKHIRVHTGERPYCCTVCGKTFTQSGSLYHHMKMHKQHDPSPQKRKTSLVLPEQTEKNVGSVSEPVTNPSQGEHMKFPALTQRLSNSSMVPQMTVFPDSSRHYLSQWRPY